MGVGRGKGKKYLTFCHTSVEFQVFMFVPRAIPKLISLKQDHFSKKWFLWSNPYRNEVIITFLIDILELPNFGHITASTI